MVKLDFREAKVCQFDVTFVGYKHVIWLQVPKGKHVIQINVQLTQNIPTEDLIYQYYTHGQTLIYTCGLYRGGGGSPKPVQPRKYILQTCPGRNSHRCEAEI